MLCVVAGFAWDGTNARANRAHAPCNMETLDALLILLLDSRFCRVLIDIYSKHCFAAFLPLEPRVDK